MKKVDETIIELSEPIKIHGVIDGKNELVDCFKLFLRAPSLNHRKHTIELKKGFIEALVGMTAFSKDDASKQIGQDDDAAGDALSAQQVLSILYASKGFDIISFYQKFQTFLASGVCFTDEDMSQRIKPSEIEKMAEGDLEGLISKYIEFFFIVSWMKTLK